MKNSFLVLLLLPLLCIAKFNIPETSFSEYVFSAQECKLIHHHESRIFIEPNTFYLNGKLYEGEVHLKYREFLDQLDIILNNIPMSYHENDKQHVLESGGMFELYAYGNGQLLSFTPGKKIRVQLAGKFDPAGEETFVFNNKTKNWEKSTPFGNSVESNQPLPDNKKELWGDNIWEGGDAMFNYDIIDTTGAYYRVRLAREQAFKTINVDKMELYNCDRILKEDAVPMAADFKLEGYSQKLNSVIYVVYKKRNAVLTYYPEQFASSFQLLPGEEFTIFTYSKDGKIAVLDKTFEENFDAKLYANKKVVFPMKVFANLPSSKKELAELTGL